MRASRAEYMKRWRKNNPEKYKKSLDKQLQREKKERDENKKPPQTRKGSDPCDSLRPEVISVLLDTDDKEWALSKLHELSNDEWDSYKLYSLDRVLGKANYRIGFNGKRFAGSKDVKMLQDIRPELFNKIYKLLS